MDKEKWPYSEVLHIGIVVKDLEKSIEYYESLGMGPFTIMASGTPMYREVYGKPAPDVKNREAMGRMGATTLALVQPVTGRSVQREFLEKHGEGVNHFGFLADDVDEEVARLEKRGFKVISSGREAPGAPLRFAYLDTDKVGGIVFELIRRKIVEELAK